MKTQLILAFALTRLYSCCYGCDDGSEATSTGLQIRSPQVDGYAGTSIGESYEEEGLLYVELRSARGDGMMAHGIQIEGAIEAGHVYDTETMSAMDVSIVRDWRPHMGGWGAGVDAHRVVLVTSGERDELRVEFTAYFDDASPMRGAFTLANATEDPTLATCLACGR